MHFTSGFLADESGLETVEWAIIVGMIVGALVTIMIQIGNWVKGQYSNMRTEVGA
jgi:Flp pilus assembly pilin Flp